jgi:hypothetical protein
VSGCAVNRRATEEVLVQEEEAAEDGSRKQDITNNAAGENVETGSYGGRPVG